MVLPFFCTERKSGLITSIRLRNMMGIFHGARYGKLIEDIKKVVDL